MRRSVLLLAAAALAAAGCGSDSEQHGPGEAEHSEQRPGMTTPTVAEDHDDREIGGTHGEAARGPGATDRHDLELELAPVELTAGERGELAFRVLDPRGDPIRRFDVEHTKQVHLIVVSKDLRHFQHVHPKRRGATWRATIRPSAPGDHRVIADVKHDGRALALTSDVTVGGRPRAAIAPAEQEARLKEPELVAGQPVTLAFDAPAGREPYLGAAGHLVVIREGTLEYLHVHAMRDELAFTASFPQPGRYVMFLEYMRDGAVRLSRFEVTVR